MDIFKFNLRDKVKDTVTGFVGVIVSRTEWTNGCIRYQVQPPVDKEGKVPDSVNFDENDLLLIAAHKPVAAKPLGGPRKDPRSPVGRT